MSYDMDAVRKHQVNLEHLSQALRSVHGRRRNEFQFISKATEKFHQETVGELKQEEADLQQEISMESQQARRNGQSQSTALSIELMDDRVRLNRARGKVQLQNLQRRIKIIDKTIEGTLKTSGDFETFNDEKKHVQRQIQRLEHRLHQARVKYSKIVCATNTLKGTLDDLNRDYRGMIVDYTNLGERLQTMKNMTTSKIEFSNEMMDARHEAEKTLLHMEMSRAELEDLFRMQWTEVLKLIERKEELHNRLRIQRRGDDAGALIVVCPDGESPVSSSKGELGDSECQDDSEDIVKQIRSTAIWSNAQDLVKMEVLQARIEHMRSCWDRITEVVKSSDVQVVVNRFLDAELDNRNQFDLVHNLQIEGYQEEAKIHHIETQLSEDLESGQPKNMARQLWSQVQAVETTIEALDNQASRAAKEWRSLKHAVGPFLNEFGYFTHLNLGEMGAIYETDHDAEVSDAWAMSHFSVIESATRTMLEQLDARNQGLLKENNANGLRCEKLDSNTPSVQPPSLDRYLRTEIIGNSKSRYRNTA